MGNGCVTSEEVVQESAVVFATLARQAVKGRLRGFDPTKDRAA